jgi:hypothetical protein
MSWYIQKIGKRASVRSEIEKDTNLPDPVKACIVSVLQDEKGAQTGVKVEGSGHTYTGEGSANSSITNLTVAPFPLVE